MAKEVVKGGRGGGRTPAQLRFARTWQSSVNSLTDANGIANASAEPAADAAASCVVSAGVRALALVAVLAPLS